MKKFESLSIKVISCNNFFKTLPRLDLAPLRSVAKKIPENIFTLSDTSVGNSGHVRHTVLTDISDGLTENC